MNELLTKKEINSVDLALMDPERKAQILKIKNNLSLSYMDIMNLGSLPAEKLSLFSNDILKSMLEKTDSDINGAVNELVGGLEKLDADSLIDNRPAIIKKLIKKDETRDFVKEYENVENIIISVKQRLEKASFDMKKDIELCNRFLRQNEQYIAELDNHILAGKLFKQEQEEVLKQKFIKLDETDSLAVQEYKSMTAQIDQLERRIHNLLIMRTIAIQNIPQILLIKNGDAIVIEKIDSSINSAIPIWESQMVIAIQLMRQRGALAVQRDVNSTANKMIEQNSKMLKSSSIEIAKEESEGVVSIETLKNNSKALLETLTAVKTIRDKDSRVRLDATRELIQLQNKLNEQMIAEAEAEEQKQMQTGTS